jgi:hypothetical protein
MFRAFRVASARYVGTFGGVELRFLRQKHAKLDDFHHLFIRTAGTFTRLHRWRGAHGHKNAWCHVHLRD